MFCFLLFQILNFLFFHLTVLIVVTVVFTAVSASVFFADDLNIHSENQVAAAVEEEFSFSDMMNEIMKIRNEQNSLLLLKKMKTQIDDVNTK